MLVIPIMDCIYFADSSSFIPSQISTFGLHVEVMWLGPNLDGFVRHLVAQYREVERRSANTLSTRAVLFFSWSPSILTTALGPSVSVAFPPCASHDTFCFYESHHLKKVVSSTLKKGAAAAYEVK